MEPIITTTMKIGDVANYYGCCEETLKPQIKLGKVLGVDYVSGRYRFCSGLILPYRMVGLVPERRQDFILPKGTTEVALEYPPGRVSGQIFHTLTLRPGQLGTLTVHTTVGCSGLPIVVTPGFTGNPRASVSGACS